MEIIQIKILLTQFLVWGVSLIIFLPDGYLGRKLDAWFGEYSGRLDAVMSWQLLMILINMVVLIWRLL